MALKKAEVSNGNWQSVFAAVSQDILHLRETDDTDTSTLDGWNPCKGKSCVTGIGIGIGMANELHVMI